MRKTLVGIFGLMAIMVLALGASAGQGEAPEIPGVAGEANEPDTGIEAGIPEPTETVCEVQPAQANDDYWSTSKNTSVTRSPIANDPDTPQNNFGGFTQPDHGTAEQVGIDAVKYTPDTGFTGTDSFNYTHVGCLQCFNGWCSEPDFDVGTVYITVSD